MAIGNRAPWSGKIEQSGQILAVPRGVRDTARPVFSRGADFAECRPGKEGEMTVSQADKGTSGGWTGTGCRGRGSPASWGPAGTPSPSTRTCGTCRPSPRWSGGGPARPRTASRAGSTRSRGRTCRCRASRGTRPRGPATGPWTRRATGARARRPGGTWPPGGASTRRGRGTGTSSPGGRRARRRSASGTSGRRSRDARSARGSWWRHCRTPTPASASPCRARGPRSSAGA